MSVFKNNGQSVNGRDVEFYSILLQRTYKDKEGVWQNTQSMGLNDLPKATLLLQKVYEDALLKDRDDETEAISGVAL